MAKATKQYTREWRERLLSFFRDLPQRVFTQTELRELIEGSKRKLGLPLSLTLGRAMPVLLAEGSLRKIELPAAIDSKGLRRYPTIRRYAWGNVSPYALGLALRKNAYLSHASAIFLHGLTNQVPRTIYVNKEQTLKPRPSTALTQEGLDRAFRSPQRTSSYVFTNDDHRYVLLSGKQTNRLEVSDILGPSGEPLVATKLERTLIDVVVRPTYGGGVFQVLEAFRQARDSVSINTLVAVLRKLDHVYPYHQAIGFYMERAEYDSARLDRLKGLGLQYDFYLTHQMTNPKYDAGWRLFYPEGF